MLLGNGAVGHGTWQVPTATSQNHLPQPPSQPSSQHSIPTGRQVLSTYKHKQQNVLHGGQRNHHSLYAETLTLLTFSGKPYHPAKINQIMCMRQLLLKIELFSFVRKLSILCRYFYSNYIYKHQDQLPQPTWIHHLH